VLLEELECGGPSGEFVQKYLTSLDALTPDDLRVLNHALEQRSPTAAGAVAQALFWGWRRRLESLIALRTR
jgi:hypothetical protein